MTQVPTLDQRASAILAAMRRQSRAAAPLPRQGHDETTHSLTDHPRHDYPSRSASL